MKHQLGAAAQDTNLPPISKSVNSKVKTVAKNQSAVGQFKPTLVAKPSVKKSAAADKKNVESATFKLNQKRKIRKATSQSKLDSGYSPSCHQANLNTSREKEDGVQITKINVQSIHRSNLAEIMLNGIPASKHAQATDLKGPHT